MQGQLQGYSKGNSRDYSEDNSLGYSKGNSRDFSKDNSRGYSGSMGNTDRLSVRSRSEGFSWDYSRGYSGSIGNTDRLVNGLVDPETEFRNQCQRKHGHFMNYLFN